MCVPLGHRNGGSRSHGGSIKTSISKSEVEQIISDVTYDICQWKNSNCRVYSDYKATTEELLATLNDGATTVSVANTLKDEYKRGYRTIVMVAPCIKAKIILRIEK